MQKFKRHISLFLLAIFALAVIPAPLVHEVFADHEDAADNHCSFYHKDLGRHIEDQQDHCQIFKADTPVYDALKIENSFDLTLLVNSEYFIGELSPYLFAKVPRLPARAPPVA